MLVFPERVLQGDIPNKRLPAPLRAGEPLGARRRVQGVRRLAAHRAPLRARCSSWRSCSGSTLLARPLGPHARRRRARSRSALIIIPFGLTALAWVGAVGLGAARSRGGSRGRGARADERVARRWALARRRCCSGVAVLFRLDLVLAVGLVDVRARCAGIDGPRAQALARRRRGVGVAPYLVHARDRRASATSFDGHGARPGRSTSAAAAACRSRRRGRTSTGSCSGPARSQQLSWPIPDLERPQQLFVWFFLLLGAIVMLLLSSGVAAASRARPDVGPGPHAARRRALQHRPRSRRRCSASTPRTSPGSAACRSASCPVVALRARAARTRTRAGRPAALASRRGRARSCSCS